MEEISMTRSRGLHFSYCIGITLISSIFLGRFGDPRLLSSTLASSCPCSGSAGSVALRLELDMEELELSVCLSFTCPDGLDIIPSEYLGGTGASDAALDVAESLICSPATFEFGVLKEAVDRGASGGEYCVLASTMRGCARCAWKPGETDTLGLTSGMLNCTTVDEGLF